LSIGFGSYYSGGALVKVAEMIGEKPWIAPLILVVFGTLLWSYLTQVTKRKVK
jgi:hypothetical protein